MSKQGTPNDQAKEIQPSSFNSTQKSIKSHISLLDAANHKLSFRVAKQVSDEFGKFLDEIIFGANKKTLLMSPIPFAVGPLKFTITRNKTGLNQLQPIFTMSLEKPLGVKVPVIYGKKRLFNKLANYLLSIDKNCAERDSANCLGKLRAVDNNEKFYLYDNGENFSKLSSFNISQLRSEHGSFVFRYEPCNVGNIRRMLVILPNVYPANLSSDLDAKY